MAFLFEEQVEFIRMNGYLIIYQRISLGMIRELQGAAIVTQGVYKHNGSFRIAESLENQLCVCYHVALLEDSFMNSCFRAQCMTFLGGHATSY